MVTRDTLCKTRDGRYIAIKDMDDHHLLSTIRVLRRMSPIGTVFRTTSVKRRRWINAMANEAYSRGLSLDELDPSEPIHE